MKETKIQFRCTEDFKERVKKYASKMYGNVTAFLTHIAEKEMRKGKK